MARNNSTPQGTKMKKKKLPEKQQVHLQIEDCMQFWWKLETDLSKMNIGVNFQTI